MKIFAIRDRIMNYFDAPFVAHTTNQVKGAISNELAKGEKIDWAQAPHHFELYELGEIDDQGNIKVEKQLITSLDSLIRPSVRKRDDGETDTSPTLESSLPIPPRGFDSKGRPEAGTGPGTPQTGAIAPETPPR